MGTAKLRRLNLSRILSSGEQETLDWNFWAIEQALNSLGAATPSSTEPPPTSIVIRHDQLLELGDDDHAQYLNVNGRTGGQSIQSTAVGDIPLSIILAASQTGDAFRVYSSALATLFKVDKDGKTTAPEFIGKLTGDVGTLTTRGDLLTRGSSTQTRLAIGSSGKFLKTDGSDPSWANISEADIADGALLARLADEETITNNWTFPGSLILSSDGSSGTPLVTLLDSTSAGPYSVILAFASSLTNDFTLFIPVISGVSDVMLTTLSSSSVGNKNFLMGTTGSSNYFRDVSSSTKRLYFKLGNLNTTSSNLSFRTSAARTWELPDKNMTIVGRVGTTDGSNLTDYDSGGVTTAIAATSPTGWSTPGAGLYRISGYLEVTTAGGADRTVDVQLGWTDDVGARTKNPLSLGAPLNGGATNFDYFSSIIRIASGSPTIATAVAGALGSAPTYRLFVRLEFLG